MSVELLNDDDADLSDLDDTAIDLLTSDLPNEINEASQLKPIGDWRTIERHLEERRLYREIYDPLFNDEYH
jgi:hypothetical protein